MPPAVKLQPDDWTTAALVAVATDGLDALSVERLAASLGVTKGSFYWHFADRGALVVAAAVRWERLGTLELIETLAMIENPRSRLRALFDTGVEHSQFAALDAAFACRADDPLITEVVQRVTDERLSFFETAFREIGLTRSMAARQARLALALHVGHAQLLRTRPDDDVFGADRRRYIDQVMLTIAR